MTARTPREINAEILAGLNVRAEYESLGVRFSGEPRQSGMVSCFAFGREDRNPSAWVNVRSGFYGDSGGGNGEASYTCSLWDFAATKAGRFADWKEARKFYANKSGVQVGREKKSDTVDWRDKLEFQSWDTPGNDVLALRWCLKHKLGVTVEAIKAAGGTLAYYPCYIDKKTKEKKRTHDCRQVIAIPAYGEWGLAADPVAWVIWDCTGREFDTTPKDYPKDQPRKTAKMLSVGQTRGTILGLSGLMTLSEQETRQAIEWVWKVEGPVDMLAAWAAIPAEDRGRHVVVTNGGGATSDVMPHQTKMLTGLRVAVVGDCDTAGQVGAEKWCRGLDGLAAEIRSVRLPWPVEPKHGKDVRDWLTGDPLPGEPELPPDAVRATRPFAGLVELLNATQPWLRPNAQPVINADASAPGHQGPGPQGPESSGGHNENRPTTQQLETFEFLRIADALEIDVLGRTLAGDVEVYSKHFARTTTIRNLAKVKLEDLQVNFGPIVNRVVTRTNEDKVEGVWPIRDVREALATLGSLRMVSEETKLGLGCWPCGDDDIDKGAPSDALILVNSSEAAHLSGTNRNMHLEQIVHPRHHGRLLSFESGAKPWYEFDRLSALLKEANDYAFRCAVVDELANLWSRWRWRGAHDPMIVTGLVLATWVQSLWDWRPRIDVLGASNTGKSMLCSALSGIFRDLVILTSDTTAAGLRQKIANRMLAIVVDEVDAKNKAKLAKQKEILEMLRSASRGTAALRGTGNQKAIEFTLRHLVWVAGITLSYDDQADRNRAISLNLLPPLPEMAGKLTLPPSGDLANLGQRSLAAALWAIREARGMAAMLKDQKIEGVDARLVESYAVPAAMIAVVMGFDDAMAAKFLADMLGDTRSDSPVESDECNLIAEILQATVQLGANRQTVGQAIEQVLDVTANSREEWRKQLEAVGIRVNVSTIAMNHGAVRSKLLRGTRWEGQPIDQTLRRVYGCKPSRQRIGGVVGRGVVFGLEDFVATYIGTGAEPEEPLKGAF